MNHFAPPRRGRGSLIERAAAEYDFAHAFDARHAPPLADEPSVAAAPKPAPFADRRPAAPPLPLSNPASSVPAPPRAAGAATVDRKALAEAGMLVPGGPIGVLAEEFRLVKRQLLLTARAVKDDAAKARTMLVCSARPNEGKTFCAINLALSLAAERDTQVLLIDGDLAKPDVLLRLGIPAGPGLIDALADPRLDPEALVVATDIPQFSVLSAGTKSNDDTELLASRTSAVLQRLLAADPRRLVIFDSPPALAASPAAVLALHAGQVMMVVRADRTTESELRQAVALLDGCEHIQLVLNQVAFTPGAQRFGTYYGTEYAK